jgi:hypothetical protein
MSKAVIFVEYGDPEVLQVVDIPPPQPGPGQVRVRVRTSGIEPFDFLIRSGLVREQISAVFPQKMGGDFAGGGGRGRRRWDGDRDRRRGRRLDLPGRTCRARRGPH